MLPVQGELLLGSGTLCNIAKDRRDGIEDIPASTADSAEGPIQCEFVVKTVDKARLVITYFLQQPQSFRGGWTIILKEGLYVDPDFTHHRLEDLELWPSLEVLGLKDVRLLLVEPKPDDACQGPRNLASGINTKMTLSNLRIYDFRESWVCIVRRPSIIPPLLVFVFSLIQAFYKNQFM